MIQKTNLPDFFKIKCRKLDINSMMDFEIELDSLLGSAGKNIWLDLGEVEEISSAILGIILRRKLKMREAGTEIYLSNVKPDIKRILKAMNLAPYFLFPKTMTTVT